MLIYLKIYYNTSFYALFLLFLVAQEKTFRVHILVCVPCVCDWHCFSISTVIFASCPADIISLNHTTGLKMKKKCYEHLLL